MSEAKDSITKNIKSYRYAAKGILHVLIFENNFKYQLIAAILAITAAYLLRINRLEWLLVTTMIGLVLMAEMFNTAIEKLCDHLHPTEHAAIGLVKDISAGAVLVVAIVAAIVGLIIFIPKLMLLV